MPSGRVAPGLPGLGMCTRRNGWGRYLPVRNCCGELIEEGSHPLGASVVDVGDGHAVHPGGAPLVRTSTHARHRTSLRATLS